MKIITPLDENQDVDYTNSYTIFLAGGCTTNWRDEFVRKLGELCKVENIVVFNPFCDSSKIKLKDLLSWERKHLLACKILVFNFEGSESPQPGSMFELGQYAFDKCKHDDHVLINVDDKYKLKREVGIHVEMMNERKSRFVQSIEMFNSGFDEMVKRCANIIYNDFNGVNYMHELVGRYKR